MGVIIFDVETNGFPSSRNPRIIDCFNTSRIVSISWVILNNNNEEVERHNYYIKNNEIRIPYTAYKIHKISKQYLQKHGVCFKTIVVPQLINSINLHNVDRIVSHNLHFDKTVLLSELYRINNYHAVVRVKRLDDFCTMRQGKKLLNLHKFPKLVDIYIRLHPTHSIPTNLHNSMADTIYCAEVYKQLTQK